MKEACVELRCHVELFGPLRVRLGQQSLTHFPRQKAAALLAYLALNRDRSQSREHLIDLLWPELDLPAGRDNLSTILSSLRRMLEPAGTRRGSILITTYQQIGLNREIVTTDVAEYERLLAVAARTEMDTDRMAALARACDLWRPEFLSGMYDDWAIREAARLHARQGEALRQLSESAEQAGDLEQATRAARRRLELDLFSEEAHLRVIALSVRLGQPAAARQAVDAMERLWQDEFGGTPSPATCQAVAALLEAAPADTKPPLRSSGPPAAKTQPKSAPELPTPDAAPQTRTLPGLPALFDGFWGREEDLARLAQALALGKSQSPEFSPQKSHRLVTLVGPGGTGKTRLALEFAHRAAARLGLRCTFVPLAETAIATEVLPAIAQALRLPPNGTDPMTRLAAFFETQDRPGGQRFLLILDNLEHLQEGDDAVARIIRLLLEQNPNLAVLCTSRRRLGLRGERVLPLDPLPVPSDPSDETKMEDLIGCASVRLYVDRAQAVRSDFALTAGNAQAIAALCRLLEGSPLALELAASWVRTVPPRRMWERLSRETGITSLETRYHDLPPRQQSIRSVLDWSLRLLSPKQQRLFECLSVFRGGWTLEAAEAVSGEAGTLEFLTELEDASLVTAADGSDGQVRYRMLETIREYAAERLAAQPKELFDAQRRHGAFFYDLARRAPLTTREQFPWYGRLEADHPNLRAALDRFLESLETVEDGLWMAGHLETFWTVRGHLREAGERLGTALRRPGAQKPTAARGNALNAAANVATRRSDLDAAGRYYRESLETYRTLGAQSRTARPLSGLGTTALQLGNLDEARVWHEEALAVCRTYEDAYGIAGTLNNLGLIAGLQGDLAGSQRYLEESLALRQARGDLQSVANTLSNLGPLCVKQGDLALAQTHLTECLSICRDLGNRRDGMYALAAFADLAEARGDLAQAVTLLGAEDSLRTAVGAPRAPVDTDAYLATTERLRGGLGEAAYEAAWQRGQRLDWAAAAAYALGEMLEK